MSFPVYERDPNSVLDYLWDWSEWLADAETISSHSIVPEAGITIDSSTNTTTSVTAWVSGGTVDIIYEVTCRITTNQGRTQDSTIRLQTKQS